MKKCPSSIWRQDSNSHPSDYESPPLTTRPGLPRFGLNFATASIEHVFPMSWLHSCLLSQQLDIQDLEPQMESQLMHTDRVFFDQDLLTYTWTTEWKGYCTFKRFVYYCRFLQSGRSPKWHLSVWPDLFQPTLRIRSHCEVPLGRLGKCLSLSFGIDRPCQQISDKNKFETFSIAGNDSDCNLESSILQSNLFCLIYISVLNWTFVYKSQRSGCFKETWVVYFTRGWEVIKTAKWQNKC